MRLSKCSGGFTNDFMLSYGRIVNSDAFGRVLAKAFPSLTVLPWAQVPSAVHRLREFISLINSWVTNGVSAEELAAKETANKAEKNTTTILLFYLVLEFSAFGTAAIRSISNKFKN